MIAFGKILSLSDYPVSFFWKLGTSLQDKGQRKAKGRIKKLQQVKVLEDSRVGVVPECVIFGILVKSEVSLLLVCSFFCFVFVGGVCLCLGGFFSFSFFCRTPTIPSLFFRPYFFVPLHNTSYEYHTSLGKFGSKPRQKKFSMFGLLTLL